MNPALDRSLTIQCFKRGDATELGDGQGMSHCYPVLCAVLCLCVLSTIVMVLL